MKKIKTPTEVRDLMWKDMIKIFIIGVLSLAFLHLLIYQLADFLL